MKYYWDPIGRQEDCAHKVCHLGPYKLEVKEVGWGINYSIKLRPAILKWNDQEHIYEELKVFPTHIGTITEAGLILIDWYELNVLADDILLD